MTCAPDAFNAGTYAHDTNIQVLEPGGSSTASWRIFALEPTADVTSPTRT
jgi:aldose 1-epimerase